MPLHGATSHRYHTSAEVAVPGPLPRSTSTRVVRGRFVDISSPVEFISSTCMQAYTAPSLRHISSSSTNSSNASSDDLSEECDGSPRTAGSWPIPSVPSASHPCPLTTQRTIVRQASQSSQSSVPNFSRTSRSSVISVHIASLQATSVLPPAPSDLSQERPSMVLRKRSASRLVHPPTRLQTTFEGPTPQEEQSSPFERELEQVDELVKTFNQTQKAEMAEEDDVIRQKGLQRFNAEVYMAEICMPFSWTWI